MPNLYFDHNAGTSVAPQVAEALMSAAMDVFGNPSSVHGPGQRARRELEAARRVIAASLNAFATELVFTSGGTESVNLAILGLVRNWTGSGKHIIVSAIEHPAGLEAARQLEREGVTVSFVPVDANGLVSPRDVKDQIRPETVLVSVMHANNETGVMQPIAEISEAVREARAAGQAIYFHSDGVQAYGKVPVDVQQLGVDLYSISGHKIFAPKGIGGLFVRKGVPLRGLQVGGRHERERRAGTENVPGAIAFRRAVELCREFESVDVSVVRDHFENAVVQSFHGVQVNGGAARRLPNTSNLLFEGISGESMVIALDLKGMAVSSGSACSSGSTEPSHVLLRMGRSRAEAQSSVRFSFGRYNTKDDAALLAEAVISCVRQLRVPARSEARLVRA